MKNLRVAIGMLLLVAVSAFSSCSDDATPEEPVVNPPVVEEPFDVNTIEDTYGNLAPFDFVYKWGPYNVHDPSIIKDGDYYYSSVPMPGSA